LFVCWDQRNIRSLAKVSIAGSEGAGPALEAVEQFLDALRMPKSRQDEFFYELADIDRRE
jgi:hypothetical protein